jgi:hypothetical protein
LWLVGVLEVLTELLMLAMVAVALVDIEQAQDCLLPQGLTTRSQLEQVVRVH